jgi:hypothetical protein
VTRPQNNNTLDTYRPSSADLQNVHENVLYNVVKSPKSKKSTATTQSEVGQLLEDVKMFSKGLTSRDDVGITLDDPEMVNCHSLQCQFSYDEFPSCLFVTFQLYLKRFPPPVEILIPTSSAACFPCHQDAC